jgi:5-methylcytosine-specific restriction endonuclease McrA
MALTMLDTPRRCSRCGTDSRDWSPCGSYCRPCTRRIRAEVAARHPDRERGYAATKQRRRRHKAYEEDWIGATCTYTGYRLKAPAAALRRLYDAQQGRCALTGEELTRENMSIDHILPRRRGGGDEIENLRWTTITANRAKRDLTDDEFLALCRAVVATSEAEATIHA